jgi:hypothetical protein
MPELEEGHTEEVATEDQNQGQAEEVENAGEQATPEDTGTPTEDKGGEEEAEDKGEASAQDDSFKGLPDGARRSINRLTRQKKEAQEREAALKRENDELRRLTSGGIGNKPNPEDFDDTESYADALAEYKLRERDINEKQNRTAEESQKAEQERRATVSRDFDVRQAKARSDLKDYNEVTGDAVAMIGDNPGAIEAIVEDKHGPEILYHLGKNPELAADIGELSPSAAAAEIGRIAARLESAMPKTRNVTKAPQPISPVAGQEAGVSPDDPGKLDDKAYRSFRESGGGGGAPQYARK